MTTTSSVAAPRTTADGSEAVAWVETHIAEIAAAYPITPSSNMASGFQAAVALGRLNLWGTALQFIELESEHSSASTAEGAAAAGARVVNFTSGQGLILMKEVLYTIAGKRLPVVFHIGARALTSQALNIHAGHDDVMGVADCGWAMLFARNVQEAADFALIARRAAEASETPFMVIQDGFLTTHTIESVRLPDPDFMKEFVGEPRHRVRAAFDPTHPLMIGVVQNQDAYMKGKIAQRDYLAKVGPAIQEAMDAFAEATGRAYSPVGVHQVEGARVAVIAMGTMAETAQAACYELNERERLQAGVVHLTSFRPFPGPELVAALRDVKAVAVLERMDDPLAPANPLTLAVKAAFADALAATPGYPPLRRMPLIVSGSAGLGGRDVRPGHIAAVVRELAMRPDAVPRTFTLGVHHEIELPEQEFEVRPEGTFAMRGHSVGGYGSITTNKIIATIVGDLFGLNVQAYPRYGSEKKGLPTTFYMVASPEPIRTHCEIDTVDFVAVTDANAFGNSKPLDGLVQGGVVFLQSTLHAAKAVEALPPYARAELRRKAAKLLVLDTLAIARACASRPELVQRTQGIVLLGAFLKAAPFAKRAGLAIDALWAGVEKSLRKYFGKRGDDVVRDNLRAAKRGYDEAVEVQP
jgi:pyruvate-ferredoxin/flavodoxin oxidoreductase